MIVILNDNDDDDNLQGCPPAGGYLGSYQRIRHLSGLSEGPPGGYPPNNYGWPKLNFDQNSTWTFFRPPHPSMGPYSGYRSESQYRWRFILYLSFWSGSQYGGLPNFSFQIMISYMILNCSGSQYGGSPDRFRDDFGRVRGDPTLDPRWYFPQISQKSSSEAMVFSYRNKDVGGREDTPACDNCCINCLQFHFWYLSDQKQLLWHCDVGLSESEKAGSNLWWRRVMTT